jgi:UDP-N-acetylmuramoylalanine--D-glutamate ligase
MGTTGQSVIRHLLSRGWVVSATDSRSNPPGVATLREQAPTLRVALGGLDVALLAHADCVIASPGLSQADPFFVAARQMGLPIIGDIELFARSNTAPVVGITGTNG